MKIIHILFIAESIIGAILSEMFPQYTFLIVVAGLPILWLSAQTLRKDLFG